MRAVAARAISWTVRQFTSEAPRLSQLRDGDVLGHGQVRQQRKVLVDDLNSLPDHLGRRGARHQGTLHPHFATVGMLDPGNDLDEGGLTGAVLADEAMHLPRANEEVDPLQGVCADKALVDSLEPQEIIHRRASAPAPRASD